MSTPVFVEPDWPVSAPIKSRVTTRVGGFSRGPFASLNLAFHVGDEAGAVEANRALMQGAIDLPGVPIWLSQIHGNQCLAVDRNSPMPMEGDAAWSDSDDVILAVMVADCLPVFLASQTGDEYAVVHAGWKGLATGVIDAALAKYAAAIRKRQLPPTCLLRLVSDSSGSAASAAASVTDGETPSGDNVFGRRARCGSFALPVGRSSSCSRARARPISISCCPIQAFSSLQSTSHCVCRGIQISTFSARQERWLMTRR